MENKNLETSPKVINTEQQNQQPIQEKTENKPAIKTNWKFVAIVVILGFLVGGGMLWYANLSTLVSQPIEISNIKKPTPQQAVDTSTWQTYRNSEFGFEVKYPKGWVVVGEDGIENQQTNSSLSIIKNNNPKNLSLDEWFREATLINGRPTIKAAAKPVTINGVKAYRLDTELPPPNPYFEIVGIADEQRHIFTIHADYKVLEDGEILNQILSTFRFVGQSEAALPSICNDEPEGMPVITSISPISGPIGTEVEIKGCNLAGFEGDLDIVFKRSDGAKIRLYGGTGFGNVIKVTVQSYCESGFITGRYSGITSECKTLKATPGVYKVYATPWDKKSNEASFTIQ